MPLFPRYDDGKYVNSGAVMSPDGKYRYHLWREWRGVAPDQNWFWWDAEDWNGEPIGEPKSCTFIMLNPSTADGDRDDPTIRRCVSFAKLFGYERMDVLNLFAWRATKPADLLKVSHIDDPVGVRNQEYFQKVIDANTTGMLICAWGAHGNYLDQWKTALGWMHYDQQLHCLGLTRHGHPKHPLFLPLTTKPVRFIPYT